MLLRLRVIRKKRRISQRWLAKKAGISRSYLCEMESGKYDNPGVKILCRIARALGCKIDDLIACEEEEEK